MSRCMQGIYVGPTRRTLDPRERSDGGRSPPIQTLNRAHLVREQKEENVGGRSPATGIKHGNVEQAFGQQRESMHQGKEQVRGTAAYRKQTKERSDGQEFAQTQGVRHNAPHQEWEQREGMEGLAYELQASMEREAKLRAMLEENARNVLQLHEALMQEQRRRQEQEKASQEKPRLSNEEQERAGARWSGHRDDTQASHYSANSNERKASWEVLDAEAHIYSERGRVEEWEDQSQGGDDAGPGFFQDPANFVLFQEYYEEMRPNMERNWYSHKGTSIESLYMKLLKMCEQKGLQLSTFQDYMSREERNSPPGTLWAVHCILGTEGPKDLDDNRFWDINLVDMREAYTMVALLDDPAEDEEMAHKQPLKESHTEEYGQKVWPKQMPDLKGSMRAAQQKEMPRQKAAYSKPQPQTKGEIQSTDSGGGKDDLATLFLNPNGQSEERVKLMDRIMRRFHNPPPQTRQNLELLKTKTRSELEELDQNLNAHQKKFVAQIFDKGESNLLSHFTWYRAKFPNINGIVAVNHADYYSFVHTKLEYQETPD